jgi:hypothetical protein
MQYTLFNKLDGQTGNPHTIDLAAQMILPDQMQCTLLDECVVYKVIKDHSATNIWPYLNHWLIKKMAEQKST